MKQKACYVKRENKKHCQELVELVMKEKGRGVYGGGGFMKWEGIKWRLKQ